MSNYMNIITKIISDNIIPLKDIIDLDKNNLEIIGLLFYYRKDELKEFLSTGNINYEILMDNLDIFEYLPVEIQNKRIIIIKQINRNEDYINKINFNNDLDTIYNCCLINTKKRLELFKKIINKNLYEKLEIELLKNGYDIEIKELTISNVKYYLKLNKNIQADIITDKEIAIEVVKYDIFYIFDINLFLIDLDFLNRIRDSLLKTIRIKNCSKIVSLYFKDDIEILNEQLKYDPYFLPKINYSYFKDLKLNGKYLRYDWNENIDLKNETIKLKRQIYSLY